MSESLAQLWAEIEELRDRIEDLERDESESSIGLNQIAPKAQLDIAGSTLNTAPANSRLSGISAQNSSYVHTEVFEVQVTSSTEITRVTGTGQNGFLGFVRIVVVGHTSGQGSGGVVGEYWFESTSTGSSRSLDIKGSFAPTLTASLSSNVLTISLASSDGSSTFIGVMEVTYYIPRDFSNNTWEVS